MLKNDQRYYVDTPQSPTMKEQQLEKNIVVDLNEGSPKSSFEETQQFPNLIQESMRMHNLMSLPCLLARHTKGKEPLVDYSQSHVVTSFEYLDILKKKTMEKAIAKEIREDK
jgi:hypothetical protein